MGQVTVKFCNTNFLVKLTWLWSKDKDKDKDKDKGKDIDLIEG